MVRTPPRGASRWVTRCGPRGIPVDGASASGLAITRAAIRRIECRSRRTDTFAATIGYEQLAMSSDEGQSGQLIAGV